MTTLGNIHPFPLFDAPVFHRSAKALLSVRGNKDDVLQQIKDVLFRPLCQALDEGAMPELLGTARRRNDTAHTIAIGDLLFPMVVWNQGRVNETKLYPPVRRDKVHPEDLRLATETLNRFDYSSTNYNNGYGYNPVLRTAKTAVNEPDPVERWLEVFYGGRPPKAVLMSSRDGKAQMGYNGNTVDAGAAAKEANELIELVLRTKRVPVKVEEKRSFFSFSAGAPKDLPMSMELRNIASSRITNESAGPPAGLADDLISAVAWRNRPVALTSQRGKDGRTRLWIEDTIGGRQGFREIPTPPGLAPNGVTMVLAGEDVHLFGGVFRDGKLSKDVWIYSLSSGALTGFGQDGWRAGVPMEKGVAWPAVAVVAGEAFVLDGATSFASKKDSEPLLPVVTRGMRCLNSVRWLEKAAPPADFCAAQVASDRRVFVVGPGNRLDGKLWMCDTVQLRNQVGGRAANRDDEETGWYALPPLPKEVGMGEVFLCDDKITYVAGFNKDGSPSSDMYQLDLNSFSGRWEHVGQCRYANGRARLVRGDGQWSSIMVTPSASRMYRLST